MLQVTADKIKAEGRKWRNIGISARNGRDPIPFTRTVFDHIIFVQLRGFYFVHEAVGHGPVSASPKLFAIRSRNGGVRNRKNSFLDEMYRGYRIIIKEDLGNWTAKIQRTGGKAIPVHASVTALEGAPACLALAKQKLDAYLTYLSKGR